MTSSAGRLVDRELRLALVMNGGISLAVWMGGVTAEIDSLRRASAPTREGSTGGTLPLWQELLRGVAARVTVDIIAGASAGGINGAILAASIARGRPLPDLKQTWIRTADYDTTMLDTDKDSQRRSVLNGDRFASELRCAFADEVGPSEPSCAATMPEPDKPPRPDGVDKRVWKDRQQLRAALAREHELPRAVTLFMTGTALTGTESGYQDAAGTSFGHSESRVRFTFRRDVRGKTDEFADRPADRADPDPATDASKRLARAARATASFPGAFEPTFIRAAETGSGVTDASEPPEGPNMSRITGLRQNRWVIDGGVLDNEPFAPVLDELVRRPVDSDVRRVIAYVVPSLGRAAGQSADSIEPTPGIVEATLGAINLPRELDVLADLRQLRELQLRAEVDRKLRARLLEDVLDPDEGQRLAQAAAALLPLYRTRRLESLVWEARVMAATSNALDVVDLRLLPNPGTLDMEPERPWIPPARKRLPWAAAAGDPTVEWRWGMSVAQRFVRALLGLVRDEFSGRTIDECAREQLAGAGITLSACLERLVKLDEQLDAAVARAVGREGAFTSCDEEVLELAHGAFAATFACAKPHLGAIVRSAAAAAVSAPISALPKLGGEDDATRALTLVRGFLKVEVLERTTIPTATPSESPRFDFHRFGLNSSSWYFADDLTPELKLAGTRYGHFGAFFKRAWRWYDWLWGRLDGSSELVSVLLDRKTVEAALDGEERFTRLHGAVAELTDDTTADRLFALREARQAGEEVEERELQRLRAAVVKRLHNEIIRSELPGLVDEYRSDMPAGIPDLNGPNVSDDDLREAFGLIHGKFTTTSISDLTSDETGRRAKWLTASSALRALSFDPKLPGARSLATVARWARIPAGRGFKSWLAHRILARIRKRLRG